MTQHESAEAVKVRVFTSPHSSYEEALQEALNEIMATPGARIISAAPGERDSVGELTILITYAIPAPAPAPVAAAAHVPRLGLPVAPGDYLAEFMEDQGIEKKALARILDWSEKELEAVFKGEAAISPGMASRLERVVGMPAASWLRYEAAYRADLAAAEDTGPVIALPVREQDITAAAKALSPNPSRWKDFVPTVRRALAAIEKSQKDT